MEPKDEGITPEGTCSQPLRVHIPHRMTQLRPNRAPPQSLPSLLPGSLHLSSSPSSSIHVREAHAQHTVPGQPLSPASFTPANTQAFHIRTKAPSQPHAGRIRSPVRLCVRLWSVCVCIRGREGAAAGCGEEAPSLQSGFNPNKF